MDTAPQGEHPEEKPELEPDGCVHIQFFGGQCMDFTFQEVRAHTFNPIDATYVVKFADGYSTFDHAIVPVVNIMAVFVKCNSDEYVAQEQAKKLTEELEEGLRNMMGEAES